MAIRYQHGLEGSPKEAKASAADVGPKARIMLRAEFLACVMTQCNGCSRDRRLLWEVRPWLGYICVESFWGCGYGCDAASASGLDTLDGCAKLIMELPYIRFKVCSAAAAH